MEWRPPHGRVRRDEAYVNDGQADGSHVGVKRFVGEIKNYRSVGTNNLSAAVLNSSSFYSKFSKSYVPVFNAQLLDRNTIALLASSSTLDVLDLIHKRTGHLNKRAIIECIKSKLVRGLEIEDKHIQKYKKKDKHVCDVCVGKAD